MYTVNDILGNAQILSAVIDRSRAIETDRPFWRDYLTFQRVNAKIFKTLYGAKSGVRMGTVLSEYANKPLRGRDNLATGTLHLANLGDRFQMGKDRLELLADLVEELNRNGMTNESVADVTNFLVDDMRELILAPEKRIDKVLADLLTSGSASIKHADNPNGIEILDIEIPSNAEKAKSNDRGKVLKYLQTIAAKYRRYSYREVLMSNETFVKYFMTSEEFNTLFKSKIGASEASVTGFITEAFLSAIFQQVGLPPVRVVRDHVALVTNETMPLLPEGKLAFVPTGELGRLRYKNVYEATDQIPGKTYVQSEGGLLISTSRTDEGRFMEYEALWVPEITQARAIVSVDLSAAAV